MRFRIGLHFHGVRHEMGADVATKDEDEGITALHMAAVEGHEAVVRLLLEMGANVATKDKSGMTARQFAAGEGYEVVVQLLLGKWANVAARDSLGMTALHYAALRGHEAVVRLLLEKGANATAMNIIGQTALDAAKAKGHRAVMRLLQSANQVRFSVENTEEGFTIHLHHDDDGHQHQPNRADQPIYSLPTDTLVIFTFGH